MESQESRRRAAGRQGRSVLAAERQPGTAGPASSGGLPGRGGERGFTLVEILVALLLLSVALFLGLALVLENPRVVRRVDASRTALRAMEATVESLRAGSIPLIPFQTLQVDTSRLETGRPAVSNMVVLLEVTPAGVADLYQVSLRARYSVLGQPLEKHMETMVWRPGEGSLLP